MNSKVKGIGATLLSAIYFGFVPLLMKTVYAGGGNSFTAAFLRFAFSIPVLFVVLKIKGVDLRITREELKHFFIITAFGYAGTTLLVFTAYNYIPTGMTTTIHFLYPTFTVAGLMIFYREKIKASKIFCVILCLIGIIMFYNGGEGHASLIGILLALCSSMTYAFYTIFLGKSEVLRDIEPMKRLFYMHIIGAMIMLAIGLISGNLNFHMTPLSWGVMALTANLTAFVGALLYQIGVKYIGAESTAMLSTFEPITSVIVGILVYGEPMTLRIFIGCAAIIASTLIIARTESKE
ncbi:MAG: EamA family transporter [Firmicutes bacterium]|nr:EamA family transporter [Bacillota bacterium]MBQ6608214.1 EamA family transporter [Bacillota bacterium]MBR3182824.1 EamA family transporter [Bacillota bacterium]MBR6224919.1 EamA family transporter [Bacillota bacterium]